MRPLAVLLALAAVFAGAAGAAGPAVTVSTSLTPAEVRYGDPVTAVVEVRYDAQRVRDPHVLPSFTPYELAGSPTVESSPGLLRVTYPLLCVSEGCLPTGRSKTLRLRPVEVTEGDRVVARTSWPPLRIDSRLTPADVRGEPAFTSPSTPPPPAYRVAPGLLAPLLLVLAGLCFLAGVAVAATALLRRHRHPAPRRGSPLELAIAYVRDAAGRPAADRRRALELLAEAVEDEGELATAAAEAAWSRRPPTAAGATALADRAEGRA